MLLLHERTRRWICRGLFLALGGLPVCTALGWAAAWHWPGRAAAWERRLAANLGVRASVADVSTPAPGVTLLGDIELCDPETNELILRARAIEWHDSANSARLIAYQPEINAAKWEPLHDWLLQEMRKPLSLAREQLLIESAVTTIYSGDRAQTFTQLSGAIGRGDAGVSARCQFRVAGDDPAGPVSTLTIARRLPPRNAADSSMSTTLALRTGQASIPFAPLAGGWPVLRSLGPHAEFQGEFTIDWCRASASASVMGELLHVDLDSLVTQLVPQGISGTARVAIDAAEVRAGWLHRAALRIDAANGQISTPLLRALQSGLGCRLARSLPAGASSHQYAQLRLEMEIAHGQVTLRGQARDDALLTDAAGVLLLQPQSPQPIAQLLRAVSPPETPLVPASPWSHWLLAPPTHSTP